MMGDFWVGDNYIYIESMANGKNADVALLRREFRDIAQKFIDFEAKENGQ